MFSKLILVFILLISESYAFAKVEAVIGSLALNKNPNLVTAQPLTDNPEIIISRPQYIVSYNKERRAPNWVAWKVEADQLGKSGRSNAFVTDKELEKYLVESKSGQHAVTPGDYDNSCFDRGHQVPSGDRTDVIENNEATFLMSNMIPQTQYLNRIIWEQLEQYTRDLVVKQNKKVYVIAGPVYDLDYGSIGPKKDIKVPSKDFKIIIILDAKQSPKDINASTPMIAVMMPNTLQDGRAPIPNTIGCLGVRAATVVNPGTWQMYQAKVHDIEKLSGITLFGF